MNKRHAFISLALISVVFMTGALSVLAQDGDGTSQTIIPADPIQIPNPLNATSTTDLIASVVGFLTLAAGSVLVVVVLVGAFQIMVSSGNPERIKQGRQTITWALIGFAIILVAGGLGTIVADILGGTAETLGETGASETDVNDIGGVIGAIDTIAVWMFNILMSLGVVFVLYAAFLYLISRGDVEKISTAKRALIYAIVALVIGVLAGGVDVLVRSVVNDTGDTPAVSCPDVTEYRCRQFCIDAGISASCCRDLRLCL